MMYHCLLQVREFSTDDIRCSCLNNPRFVHEGQLIAFLKENGEINTPRFKDMTGASRKYTIPLIEYFDKSQVTVRVGDNRILRKK